MSPIVLKEYDSLEMWEASGAFNLAAQIGVYGGYPASQTNPAMARNWAAARMPRSAP
ncbi:MAG: hypothetical protein R2867_12900 [Caldilineaceae bacterium]